MKHIPFILTQPLSSHLPVAFTLRPLIHPYRLLCMQRFMCETLVDGKKEYGLDMEALEISRQQNSLLCLKHEC